MAPRGVFFANRHCWNFLIEDLVKMENRSSLPREMTGNDDWENLQGVKVHMFTTWLMKTRGYWERPYVKSRRREGSPQNAYLNCDRETTSWFILEAMVDIIALAWQFLM